MLKKYLIAFIVIVVLLYTFKILSRNPQESTTDLAATDIILFWGQGCSHCETVKNYIKSQNLDTKLKISQKEVYYNRQNQKEMEDYALRCPEIDQSQGIGVPFAWLTSESRCLIGDQPIIDWLNQKAQVGQ